MNNYKCKCKTNKQRFPQFYSKFTLDKSLCQFDSLNFTTMGKTIVCPAVCFVEVVKYMDGCI